MKTKQFLAIALAATAGCGVSYAAGPQLDKAVAYAAPDSEASLEQLCKAAYDAALESPREADIVFERILSQRKNWNASQVYAILRSILLAVPDLEEPLYKVLTTSKENAVIPVKDYKGNVGVYHAGGEEGAYEDDSDWDTVAENLVRVLRGQDLPPNVVEDVIRNVEANHTPAPPAAEDHVDNYIDTNTNAVPTPPPTSTDK